LSSPTIALGPYPSLATIMDLTRSLVNDAQAGATGTPGEGQILTNNPVISPFTQPFLNSAIRQLYRELRNIGQATLIKDNVVILNIPPLTSPTYGLGMADAAVQTFLGFGGYFDGFQMNSNIVLPSDVLFVEKVWERQSNTPNDFIPMIQPQSGLRSRRQTPALYEWEWRNDSVWMVGSTQTRDLRLRYMASLPQFFSPTLDLTATYVPVMDSEDVLAYKTAVLYARMLGSPGLPDLIAEAKEQTFQLKNQNTRRGQSVDYHRIPHGSHQDYHGRY
jgi:hypothetical protein